MRGFRLLRDVDWACRFSIVATIWMIRTVQLLSVPACCRRARFVIVFSINLSKGGLEVSRREGFTGRTMTQFGRMTASMDIGSRLCRLPLVLLMTVSLLFSLLHCATCDLDFANTDGAIAVVSVDQNSTPDTAEHLLPCHHCLSHVTAQQLSVFAEPTDLIPAALSFLREQFRASSSGLLPFKPPRA